MENTPKTNKSAGHAKAKRGRPKKKPGYDRTKIIDELLAKTVELFGMPYDDREERPEDSPTIASVANTLQMTPLKVRKLLITAGYYSTAMSRKVQALHDKGYSIQQIMDKTGLSKASVNAYLPYTKGAYNLDSPTLYAEHGRLFRARQGACKALQEHLDAEDAGVYLWEAIEVFANYPFTIEDGLTMKYTVRDCQLFFNRKDESVTKTAVIKAFHHARRLQKKKVVLVVQKNWEVQSGTIFIPCFFESVYARKSRGSRNRGPLLLYLL